MKILQFLFCYLALFCVAAAVMIGLLGEYRFALIPLAAAVVFGILLLLTARKKNVRSKDCADLSRSDRR